MLEWSNITCFDFCDETLFFGTRAVAISDGNVYESNTLATIEPNSLDNFSSSNPVYKAIVHNDVIAAVTDGSITLLTILHSEVLLNVTFDDIIEIVEFSDDGTLLLVGLKNSALICIHVRHQYCITLSESLQEISDSTLINKFETDHYFLQTRFEIVSDSVRIIVVNSKLQIISLHGFSLSKLNECSSLDDSDFEAFIDTILFDVFSTFPINNEFSATVVTSDIYRNNENMLTIVFSTCEIKDKSSLKVISLERALVENIDCTLDGNIIKIAVTSCSRYAICLMESGCIAVIFLPTFVILHIEYDLRFQDLIAVKSIRDNSDNEITTSILGLMKSNDGYNLQLIQFPDFKVSISIKVPQTCALVKQIMSGTDMYYLEGKGEPNINSIAVKAVVESSAELRLQRLLKRSKFVEAEDFAQMLNFNLEYVYKAKAKKLASDISFWNSSNESGNDLQTFEEIKCLLKKIKDVEFVVRLCMNSIFANISWINEIFTFAMSLLKESKMDHYQKLFNELGKLIVRLNTFKCLNCIHTAEEWIKFSKVSVIQECQYYLSKGDLYEAVLLCSHLKKEFCDSLTTESGIYLLEVILTDVPVKHIIYWLKFYIPCLLSGLPYILESVIEWLKNRMRHIQLNADGPELCLELTDGLLSIISPLIEESSDILICGLSDVQKLVYLKDVFRNSVYLQKTHSVYISFDLLCLEKNEKNFKEILFYIFENISYQDISPLINDFVRGYCSEHELLCDSLILSYINKTMSFIHWSDEDNSYYEKCCISFINCILNIEKKMEAVICLLSHATIPWIPEVQKFAEDILLLNLPSSTAIHHEIKQAKKKNILKKYNMCHNVELNDDIRSIVKLILAQGDTYNDAKNFVNADSNPDSLIVPYEQNLFRAILKGNIDEAINDINMNLEYDNKLKLFNRSITSVEVLSQSSDYNFSFVPTVHKSVVADLNTYCNKVKTESCDKKGKLNNLKALFTLKERFDINLNLSELCQKNDKLMVVKKCVQKMFEEKEEIYDFFNINPSILKANHISYLLNLHPMYCLLEITKNFIDLNEFDLAAKFIEEIVAMEKCLHHESYHFTIECLKLLDFENLKTKSLILQLHRLISSCMNCNIRLLSRHLDVLHLLEILAKPIFGSPDRATIYIEGESPDVCTVSKKFLLQLIQYLFPSVEETSTHEQMVFYDNQTLSMNFLNFLRSLNHSFHSLVISCHVNAMIMSKETSLERDVIKQSNTFIMQMLSEILFKTVTSQKLDLNMALNLLHFFQPEHSIRWLNNVFRKSTIKELNNISLLGNAYCSFHKSSEQKDFSTCYISTLWDRRLQKFKNPSQGEVEQQKLLISAMKNQFIELSFLRQYCEDIHCDLEDTLYLYLEQLLTSWKPSYTVRNVNGKNELLVTPNNALFCKCSEIVEEILNIQRKEYNKIIVFLTHDLWEKVNYYHYEIFCVIIELLKRSTSSESEFFNYTLLLGFLTSYTRVSPPSTYEEDRWDMHFPNAKSLPPIAQYRLPFIKGNEELQNSILTPEFTLDTYKIWLQAPAWFSTVIQKDNICFHAVKNVKSMSPHLMSGIYNDEWDLQHKYKDLVKQITECADQMENLGMATGIQYFAVNRILPPGSDQVDLIQRCFAMARDWAKVKKSDEALTRLKKVNEKYILLSITHILHEYKLAKSEYLSLVEDPVDLITALYHDSSIIEMYSVSTFKPDIHRVATMIADVHGFNLLSSLRLELLSKWLQAKDCENSFLNESLNNKAVANPINDNIIRVCYMIQSDILKAGSLLVGYIFGRSVDERCHSTQLRLRALQCLFYVTNPEQLQEITGKSFSYLRNHLEVLKFLYELESLRQHFTDSGFEKKNKKEIVLFLLSLPAENAILLSSKIAIYYKINDLHIWNNILAKLVNLNETDQLEKCLLEVTDIALLLDEAIIIKAWKKVLVHAYSKVKAKPNQVDLDKCLSLIHSCPVFKNLSFICDSDINNLIIDVLEKSSLRS